MKNVADAALGVSETSQVVVETVEKVSNKTEDVGGSSLPTFHSDASKVSSKGLGLKRAHPGRQNNFTVNAGMAGQSYFLSLGTIEIETWRSIRTN